MAARRLTGFFSGTRRDLPLMAVLGLFLLLVPVLHPLAEVVAAGKPYGGIICTAFGQRSTDGRTDILPGAVDDCPCCVACTMHCAVAVPVPAVASLPLPSAEPLQLVPLRLSVPLHPSEPRRPPGHGPPFVV